VKFIDLAGEEREVPSKPRRQKNSRSISRAKAMELRDKFLLMAWVSGIRTVELAAMFRRPLTERQIARIVARLRSRYAQNAEYDSDKVSDLDIFRKF
jgi:hypothetical protein